jgi:hypothetical protein
MQPVPEIRNDQPSTRRPRIWWWVLVPIFTFGLGTFVMVLLGGIYRRSRLHIAAAVVYFLLIGVFVVAGGSDDTGPESVSDVLSTLAFLIIWFGGIAHVAVLQTRIRQQPVARPVRNSSIADPAVVAAQWRSQRRQEARALLTADPVLAADLHIGRPDIADRQYDDGGLIDVNHVPADQLASELDLPSSLASAIVSERIRLAGFSSPEELMVYCAGLTPGRLEMIRGRLVFIPM